MELTNDRKGCEESMEFLKNIINGVLVGIGGVAPGLSGSVILIILGLYEKTIKAIGTLITRFKKNIKFLAPLALGAVAGILLFSNLVKYLLANYEFQTRYTFFGLIIGTVPVFFKELQKRHLKRKHYGYMGVAVVVGFMLFVVNARLFPQITNPNWLQSILLGVVVAASSIIPGVDSAAILLALGMYEAWIDALATLNLGVLLPAVGGILVSGILISAGINFLLERRPRTTFSIIFGLFLSMLPKVIMTPVCLKLPIPYMVIAADFFVIGLVVSLYFGNYKKINRKIRDRIKAYKKRRS